MNIKNIIDYVMNTPFNTNKAVLEGMLKSLLDENVSTEVENENYTSLPLLALTLNESQMESLYTKDGLLLDSETSLGLTEAAFLGLPIVVSVTFMGNGAFSFIFNLFWDSNEEGSFPVFFGQLAASYIIFRGITENQWLAQVIQEATE